MGSLVEASSQVKLDALHSDESEDQTSIGNIIYPPPEIRTIIDKSALFVARNGPEFESRIREKESQNAKFSFLIPTDPYHAYYRYQIRKNLTTNANAAITVTEDISDIAITDVVVPEPVEPEKKVVPLAPTPYLFMTEMPAIRAQDLDIVRLTAQFFARNGADFISGLFQRESRNFQFDFLRPNHSLHNYFTRLVDQYTHLLLPPSDMESRLKEQISQKSKVLDHIRQVVEWRDYEAQEKQKREANTEKERALLASIDWHDAILVESIVFTEEDINSELPDPLTLSDLQARSIAEKHTEAEAALYAAFGYEGAKSDIARKSTQGEHTHTFDGDKQPNVGDNVDADDDEGMDMDTDQPAAPLKIRKDYVPLARQVSAAAVATAAANEQELVCPRCQKRIPASQMEEHMRIELLDPRWREQRQKEEERDKALRAVTVDAEKYLRQMARQRADIFGGEEEEETRQRLKEEDEARIQKEAQLLETFEKKRQERQERQEREAERAAASAAAVNARRYVSPIPMPIANERFMKPESDPKRPKMEEMPEKKAEEEIKPVVEKVAEEQIVQETTLEGLISEKQYLASREGNELVLVQIHIPQDGKFGGKLLGQVEEIEISIKETIASLKKMIFERVQVPVNKQRLKLALSSGTVVPLLKDNLSLAYYNIDENAILTLSLKERGGKK